jgi:hypothetical protein
MREKRSSCTDDVLSKGDEYADKEYRTEKGTPEGGERWKVAG